MAERGTSYEGSPPTSSAGKAGEHRVALVIGNSAYPTAPLKNPRNDAEAFSEKLMAVYPAFDVTVALDVGRDAMEDALERFEAKLGNCDTALLFFAGHGLQVKGTNFLMPVDADIRQEIHLRRRAFSLNEVLDIMGRRVRQSSLVFLDACRDNPFARSLLAGLPDDERGRFLTRSGLAEVRAGAGSFVAFATAPDNVALDGAGQNSPFTSALLKHMEAPGASINDVMIAVRRDVLKVTGGRQEPWDQSSLRTRFCFHNVEARVTPEEKLEPASQVQAEPQSAPAPEFSDVAIFEKAAMKHWEAVEATTDPKRLHEFLAEYGTSRMGKLAREALQRLATARWRKLNKRDGTALVGFIADYAGTKEIAEAADALVKCEAQKSEAQQAPSSVEALWNQAPIAFATLLAIAVLPITFVMCAVWKEKGRSFFGPDSRLPSALVMAGLFTSTLTLTLARWRGGKLSGIELALYWFSAALGISMLAFGVIFGLSPPGPLKGPAAGCVAILGVALIVIGLFLARRRGDALTWTEVAIYWLATGFSVVTMCRGLRQLMPLPDPELSAFLVMLASAGFLIRGRSTRLNSVEATIYAVGLWYMFGEGFLSVASSIYEWQNGSTDGMPNSDLFVGPIILLSIFALCRTRSHVLGHIEVAAYWFMAVYWMRKLLMATSIDAPFDHIGALFLAIVSALLVARARWNRLSGIEIGVFWLGISTWLCPAFAGIFYTLSQQPGFEQTLLGDRLGGLIGCLISAVAGMALYAYRGKRKSDAEKVIYLAGSFAFLGYGGYFALPMLSEEVAILLGCIVVAGWFGTFRWANNQEYAAEAKPERSVAQNRSAESG